MMFDTIAEIIEMLEEGAEEMEVELPRAMIERMAATALPAIGFVPFQEQPGSVAGTRLGGRPALGAGMEWPRRPVPDDPMEIAGRAANDFTPELVRHLKAGLPYAFVAQIDLAEAKALGEVAASLPGEGRLLFFYDLTAGPWDIGEVAGRVIWDRTPAGDLERAEWPTDLWAAHANDWKEAKKLAEKFDNEFDPNQGTRYAFPEQAVKLERQLALPSPSSADFAASGLGEIFASDPDGEIEYLYQEMPSPFDLPHENAWQRHRLAGPPWPEQSDPRFDAVMWRETGKMFPDREDYEKLGASLNERALEWRMLLQVDLSDLQHDQLTEGTVYFVIHEDDLAERNFSKVVSVYQQT